MESQAYAWRFAACLRIENAAEETFRRLAEAYETLASHFDVAG